MSDDDEIKPFDVPLGNDPNAQPFGSPVIDFGSVRVAHGKRRFNYRSCEHRHLVYSPDERRIWCEECERTIEAYDAFIVYTKYFQEMERAAKGALQRARELENAFLVRKKAKEIDRTWGNKMAILCPHCRGGILPEDNFGSAVSRELELARRKKVAARATPSTVGEPDE